MKRDKSLTLSFDCHEITVRRGATYRHYTRTLSRMRAIESALESARLENRAIRLSHSIYHSTWAPYS